MRALVICFVILSHFANSQSSNGSISKEKASSKLITNDRIALQLLGSKHKITETYKEVVGSPYIENYLGLGNNIPLGRVYDVNMKFIGSAFVMYNAYTDEMEIAAIEDSDNFYRLKKQSNSYYIELKKKLYRAYVSDYHLGYFIILSENDHERCTLLKKEKVLFIKGSQQNVSLVRDDPASFTRIKDVYYMKLNNLVFRIPNKKKLFFDLFSDKKLSVRNYVEENRLKISAEEDLLSIIDYYNSLN